MPTTGRLASPLRPVLLAAALAAALPAGCGGSSPHCDLPPVVKADQAWQVFGPAEWPAACGTLTVDVPALASDERAALLLVNAGGPAGAATVSLAGTFGLADAAPAPLAALALDPAAATAISERSALDEGHALTVERRRAATEAWLAEGAPAPLRSVAAGVLAPAAAPQVGDPAPNGGFCVYSYTTNTPARRPAKLRHLSTHALFYVTDDVWAGFQNVLAARPDFWATLESYFEGTVSARNPSPVTRRILPSLHEAFGQESDVDGNGRLIFLFADLGRTGTGGFTVGYFDSTDVIRPTDTSANCRDPVAQGSNGADMLYLLDPCTYNRNGIFPTPASCDASGDGGGAYPYSRVIDQDVPGTMAHELQHDVLFQTRCRPDLPSAALPSCAGIDDPARDLWLNEGLAMTSEDFAGFGLGGAGERSRMGVYLNCKKASASALCHQDVSLTSWPSDEPGNPTGHYGGAHAFVRWHADQATAGRARADLVSAAALTRALVGSGKTSRLALADVSGRAFEEGYARFATAALFSGEDPLFTAYPLRPAPAFSFASGVPWSPLHQRLTVDIQTQAGTTTYLGYVAYDDLLPTATPAAPLLATLQRDGWRSYVTRRGSGADVRLQVASAAGVKPRAVVVRFKGTLPKP